MSKARADNKADNKIGGVTLRSIGQVAKLQSVTDNNESYVPPREMLRELMDDNKKIAAAMRKARKVADDYEDVASLAMTEIISIRATTAPAARRPPAPDRFSVP